MLRDIFNDDAADSIRCRDKIRTTLVPQVSDRRQTVRFSLRTQILQVRQINRSPLRIRRGRILLDPRAAAVVLVGLPEKAMLLPAICEDTQDWMVFSE